MANLTGSTISSTYTELLRMGNATLHATTGYYIKDSADTNSVLSIATTRVGIGTNAADSQTHATNLTLLHIHNSSDYPAVLNMSGGTGSADSTIGKIEFSDPDNTDEVFAQIVASADGTDGGQIGIFTQKTSGALTEVIRILESGNVGIGTDSPDGSLDVSSTNAEIYVKEWSSSLTTPPEIKLQKNRGTSVDGSNSSVLDNTELGKISFWGWNDFATANQDEGASIFARVNGTPTNSNTDMPTELVFCTTADASATPTERMYISSAGNVGIGEASPGVELDIAGRVAIGNKTELTISSGAITITQSYHIVDTEGDASADNLDTINGGVTGTILVLQIVATGRDVTVTESGNCKLYGADAVLNHVDDTITLIYNGSNWNELTRGNNA